MTVWRAAAIENFPQIALAEWSVFEVSLGLESGDCTRHFVGVTTSGKRRAQISSPVLMFDRRTGRGVTESGRVYQLLDGRNGLNSGVLRTWARWKEINHIVEDRDVTEQIVRDMQPR